MANIRTCDVCGEVMTLDNCSYMSLNVVPEPMKDGTQVLFRDVCNRCEKLLNDNKPEIRETIKLCLNKYRR